MTTTLNASTAGAGGFIATSDNSGVLALQTGGTTAITVDTSQNVGIGTTSPASKLQVSTTSGTLYQYITNTGTGDAGIRMQSSTTADYAIFADSVNALRFYDFKAVAERMRIDSGGNLLVGNTTFASGQNGVLLRGTNSGATDEVLQVRTSGTGSKFNTAFYNDNGRVGSINTNGSATTYNTSSDYRLKENITPMTGALAKVAQLKPVKYKWKVDGADGEGFIAHELAEVCPHAVTGAKDAVDAEGNPVYQGIDTSFLVATLTAAIQELKAINDTQAETINALTARIVALEQA